MNREVIVTRPASRIEKINLDKQLPEIRPVEAIEKILRTAKKDKSNLVAGSYPSGRNHSDSSPHPAKTRSRMGPTSHCPICPQAL